MGEGGGGNDLKWKNWSLEQLAKLLPSRQPRALFKEYKWMLVRCWMTTVLCTSAKKQQQGVNVENLRHIPMMLRGLTANNGPHLLLLWSQCECHAKNAMRGQFRDCNRGEFLLRYKAVFYCRPMPEQGQNTSSSRNTNFWKGEAGANKVSSGGSELSTESI